MSQSEAEARLGISRTLFEANFRPQLTEYPFGPRALRYSWDEIERVVAESVASQQEGEAAMFWRRTIGDALDYATRTKWSKAKGSFKKAQLVKVVRKDVGAKTLSSFDYNAMDAWVTRMEEEDQAAATIRSKVSCLLTALKLVQPKGWIKVIPGVPPLGKPKAKVRWITEAEEQKLYAACEDQRRPVIADTMKAVIEFLVDTGARLGELIKVQEDSLSTRGSLTYVRFLDRKAEDDLRLPLTPRAEAAILKLLASRFWQSRVRGVRNSAKRAQSAQNWITHRFAEIRNSAGLLDVSAHSLRHTCGSRLVQRGADIYRVQKWLGHRDIRMTERYSHLGPSALDSVVELLNPTPENVTRLSDRRRD